MSLEITSNVDTLGDRPNYSELGSEVRDQADVQTVPLPKKVGFAFMLAFIFLLYSRILDFFLPYLHLPIITASIALAVLILAGGIGKVFASPPGKLLIGFSLWLCLAIPTSVWRGGSIEVVTDEWLKSFAAFVIVGGLIVSLKQLTRTMTALALAFFTASILVLGIGVSWEGRLTLPVGLYSGPNEVAMAMLAGCVFWWWKISKPSTGALGRVIAAGCLLPILYVIPKTASRGGLLVALLLFPFLLLRRMGRGRPLIMVVLLAGILVGTFLLPKQLKDRFATMLPSDQAPTDAESAQIQEEAKGSTEERWYLLKTSVGLTLRNPLLGVGPGQFEVAENAQAASSGFPRGAWHGTHNTYTQISSEAGIPALVLFVIAMGWCWKELVQIEKRSKAQGGVRANEILSTAFALRAFLLVQIVYFAFAHLGYEAFFPTLAGMVFALSRIAKAELRQRESPESLPVPDEAAEPLSALSSY